MLGDARPEEEVIWLAVLCVLAGIVGILGALTYWLVQAALDHLVDE